jgi:hypothetical protein
VSLLFCLAAVTVDRRCRCTRIAYDLRRHIRKQAELRNRIDYLEGHVEIELQTSSLLERGKKMGIQIGSQDGDVVVAPPHFPTGVGQ